MDSPLSDFHFRVTSLAYKFRDFFLPRKNVLKEVGIKPGFRVLDFGCGPGAYIMETAKLVGQSGKIYALDIHPLAAQKVQKIASQNQLENVATILSDCKTGLPDASLDVVLLYDTFHNLGEPDAVLEELHRVLRPGGVLSFSDHHMKEDEIVRKMRGGGLFRLSRRGPKTYSFLKEESKGVS